MDGIFAEAARIEETDRSFPGSSYTSCITVKGRPILPPLMTPERRKECSEWKDQALRLEEKLKEKRSGTILNAIRVYRPASAPAIEVTRYSSRPNATDADVNERTKWDSVVSVNTVIENPAFVGVGNNGVTPDSDDPVESLPSRERRGSYTLVEPSPLLKAYMKRFGKQISLPSTELSRSSLILPRSLSAEEQQNVLDSYLDEISRPPKAAKKKNEEPIEKSKTVGSEQSFKMSQSEQKEEACEKSLEQEVSAIAEFKKDTVDRRLPDHATKSIEVEKDDFKHVQGVSSSLQDDSLSLDVRNTSLTAPNSALASLSPSLQGSVSLKMSQFSTEGQTPMPTRDDNLLHVAKDEDETNGRRLTPIGETTNSGITNIEASIAALAKRQQADVEKLIAQHAKEKEEMRNLFNKERERLMQQILSRMQSNLNLASRPADAEDAKDDSVSSASTVKNVESIREQMCTPPSRHKRSRSPLIPTVAMHLRPESRILPEGFSFPSQVYSKENERRFCKLSALAKGHLTRKLMKTDKVQSIINSMRESMTIALQLHNEARKSQGRNRVAVRDVDLHRRLLQQLYKDSTAFHDVFFRLTAKEQMALLTVDRDLRLQRKSRGSFDVAGNADRDCNGNPHPTKKLSAVTIARMEQKKQIKKILEELPGNHNLNGEGIYEGACLTNGTTGVPSAKSSRSGSAKTNGKKRYGGTRRSWGCGKGSPILQHLRASPKSFVRDPSPRKSPSKRNGKTRRESAPAEPWR